MASLAGELRGIEDTTMNEQLVAELLAEVRSLRAELAKRPVSVPHREVYTKAEAGELLGGVSVQTVDRMIARGQLSTCELGGREGIPRRAIERMGEETKAPVRAGGRKKTPTYDPKREAAEYRERLKKR